MEICNGMFIFLFNFVVYDVFIIIVFIYSIVVILKL